MNMVFWLGFLWIVLTQLAIAWLISMELWFLKSRPWLGGALQFAVGVVVLGATQLLAARLPALIILFGAVLDQNLDVEPSPYLWALLSLGVVVLFIRLCRLARAHAKTLAWQSTWNGDTM